MVHGLAYRRREPFSKVKFDLCVLMASHPNPAKFKIISFSCLAIICCLLFVPAAAQSDCKAKTANYITRLKTALQVFIPDPGNDVARDKYLESLRQDNSRLYDLVANLSKEAVVNMDRDSLWLQCFQQEFLYVNPTDKDENIVLWYAHLFKRFATFEFNSPEFAKGFGIHVDANQGAADLGQPNEAYSFAARLMAAYTFSKSITGGRVRILGGVSTYYFNNRFLWFANPRVEYRIADVDNDFTTFGNIKAIADANFGRTWIAGVGIGLELHTFGIQLMYQRQGEIKNSHFHVGVFYRFIK